MRIRQLRQQQFIFYRNLKPVLSPALGEAVFFTNQGFKHLLYKNGRKRSIGEQYLKLYYLSSVPEVIQSCISIAEIRTGNHKFKNKIKKVTWFALTGKAADNTLIKVIVEKRSSGRCYFLSVMPLVRPTKKRHHGVA